MSYRDDPDDPERDAGGHGDDLRTQRARRLDLVAPAAAIHAYGGNLVISQHDPAGDRRRRQVRGRDLPAHRGRR